MSEFVCVCVCVYFGHLLRFINYEACTGGWPSRAAEVALTSCVKATAQQHTYLHTHTHPYIHIHTHIYTNLPYELWPAPTGRSWRSLRRTNNVISITNQSDRQGEREREKERGGGEEGKKSER